MKLALICIGVLFAIAVEGSPDSCAFLPRPSFCLIAWYKYWYYHALKKTCVQWHYKGCGGGDNNFGTKEECESTCGNFDRTQLCRLKPDKGSCVTNQWRFYYNPQSKKCESFIYGGCGGNQNNFGSRKSCYQACSCDYVFPLTGEESGKSFISWTKFGDI